MTIFQITLISIKGNVLLAVALLDQLECRDIAMALSDFDIQAVRRESEQQLPALGQILAIQINGMRLKDATRHE